MKSSPLNTASGDIEPCAGPGRVAGIDFTSRPMRRKPIAVAPGTRIEPSYSVAPAALTPDGDKRIRIDIRLQGVDQK